MDHIKYARDARKRQDLFAGGDIVTTGATVTLLSLA
jgi:hypothetical protein